MDQEVISIFCVTFNTQSVRLCENLDPKVVTEHRRPTSYGYISIPSTWLYNCEIADFIVPLLEKINTQRPTILAFAFQEDVSPASYFHSHLLPGILPQYGYTLLDRINLMGIGKTTITALAERDIKTRGLRLSIYVKSIAFSQITKVSQATYTNSIFRTRVLAQFI